MPVRSSPNSPGPARWPVAVAVVLTLGLRLWFVLSMRGQPFSTPSPQVVDSWFYYRWALDIMKGDFLGSDVFFLRPLYPYLMAALGANILAIQLFQVLLAGFSCLMLWDITRRVFGRQAANPAALGFALCGILVFYTGALLYVEITVFLGLASVWLLLVASSRWWRWLLAGLSFGLLVICRPELLVLLPAIVGWLGWKRAGVGRMALMTAVALAVIAIVPLRNYMVARDPVLFTAHSGINFYYGNNPDADGTWSPTAELEQGIGFSHERLKRASRIIDGRERRWSEASAHWMKKGLGFIVRQPKRFLALVGRKFLLFWADYEVPNNYYPETARAGSLPLRLAFVSFGLIAALAVWGMVRAWKMRRQAALVYFMVAGFLVSALVFYVLSRLRAPVIPFLLSFAGFGLSELRNDLRRRQTGRLVLGVGLAVAVMAGSFLVPVNRSRYSAQAWTQFANIWLERHRAAQAIPALNRALAADPGNISARYSLIQAYAGMGRVAEAEAELKRLAGAVGSDAAAQSALRMAAARVAIARRDYARAVAGYEAELTENPDNSEAWFMLGLIYIDARDLERAYECLTRAVELDPLNDAAAAALARVRRSVLGH
uniref:Tetratricopeptide repeat protein n=1 Tax=candidate division WOR-3 bacterium TaxID=2052148 RepID=A0A7C4GH10_UNCW3